jgi:hypothetical protein
LGNDPKRRYPAVGNVIADGHVCIVCPARNDSVCHGAARLIKRQPRRLSSLLGKARDSSMTICNASLRSRHRSNPRRPRIPRRVAYAALHCDATRSYVSVSDQYPCLS